MAVLQFREALNQAMCEEMDRNPDVFLIGEEVAEYDGAYKVSQGMLAKYGPMRIVDSPISECGFAGLGIGAAMVGMRPIVEFMTFSFSLVAFDQVVNNAPKMAYMSGGQFKVPIVFRGISGPGQQFGATHSWSVEALYTHVPGLKVVVPTTPAEAKGLLKTAIRGEDPVIFLENESMYGNKGEVPDGTDFLLPFGVADVKREGSDCTIIAWGQGCITALAAAEQLQKEAWHQRRNHRPAHPPSPRPPRHHQIRQKNRLLRHRRNRLPHLRHRRRTRRPHPRTLLRRPRQPRRPRRRNSTSPCPTPNPSSNK